MAENYDFLGSSNTTQNQGGGPPVPVQQFAIRTHPSPNRSAASADAPGVYFQFRRPISQLKTLTAAERKDLIDSVATQLAGRIEAVMEKVNVEDMSYSQPTTRAGQLLDIMTVYVQSDSGNSDGTVDVPLANIGPGAYTSSRIADEVEALNDAESL